MFVLYIFDTDRSGIFLANALGVKHGERPPPQGKTLIRWGCSRFPELDDSFSCVINPRKAIRNAARKIETLPLLEKAGVRVPPFSYMYKELWDRGFTQIVGQTSTHTAGRGFHYYKHISPKKRTVGRDYYLAYIEGEEYRVLKAFDAFWLYRRSKRRDNADIFCRSTENGWGLYRIQPQERLKDVWTQALLACETLGLALAGVDIRLRGKEAFVLEVNTAPRLNARRAQFISQQINKVIMSV